MDADGGGLHCGWRASGARAGCSVDRRPTNNQRSSENGVCLSFVCLHHTTRASRRPLACAHLKNTCTACAHACGGTSRELSFHFPHHAMRLVALNASGTQKDTSGQVRLMEWRRALRRRAGADLNSSALYRLSARWRPHASSFFMLSSTGWMYGFTTFLRGTSSAARAARQ